MGDAYRLCPDADYLYHCDRDWWNLHLDPIHAGFEGALYTQHHKPGDKEWAESLGITAIEGRHVEGLGHDAIHFNDNSGAQGVNLAYLLDATRIVLLGFDMQNTDGQAHFFGDHPPQLSTGNYGVFVERFTQLARDLSTAGVEVINCTRQTALYQFRRATLEEVCGY